MILATLTRRQRTVLQTLNGCDRRTARWMGVRSDVLWRMEEQDLVARNSDPEPGWYITPKGRRKLGGCD